MGARAVLQAFDGHCALSGERVHAAYSTPPPNFGIDRQHCVGIQLDSTRRAKANAEGLYPKGIGTRLWMPYLARLQGKGCQICCEKWTHWVTGRPRGYPNLSERLAPYFRAP